ncbi:MAG TPA: hypothetical protein VEC01_08020 [Noviherbaspirillum sp.]|uniref:hypothetical protein n=1 Tax=Noviherbaspirillum sp. TaxID=1926288 RepID=UPI002D4E0424|nr:hypothetical protein [Noviherbaspirillum sp.]HYD95256.1 hypothetical protein [Noviherbaspirillum sp.]
MAKRINIDPEFESLITPLADDEYNALEQSILAEGCRHPLVTWRGILIDGHHRYKICKQHDKSFRTVECPRLDSRESVMAWMIDNQLARRNLSDYQRTALGLKKKDIIAARAKVNLANGKVPLMNSSKAPVNTRKEIAAIACVSEDTVAKVEKIQVNAVPPIRAAANAGDISINAAAKLAALPPEQQQAIAAGGEQAMKEAARQIDTKPAKKAAKESAAPAPAQLIRQPSELGQLRAENARLRAESDALRAENDALRADLAEQAALMEGLHEESQVWVKIVGNDDHLAAARAEIQKLQELVRVMESRNNGLLNEKNEYLRLSKKHKSAAERLERRLKGFEKNSGSQAHAA